MGKLSVHSLKAMQPLEGNMPDPASSNEPRAFCSLMYYYISNTLSTQAEVVGVCISSSLEVSAHREMALACDPNNIQVAS